MLWPGGPAGPGRPPERLLTQLPDSFVQRTLLVETFRALDPGKSGHGRTLTCQSPGGYCPCSLWRCCSCSTSPWQPERLRGRSRSALRLRTSSHPGSPEGPMTRAHACLTWPPQVPAPLGHRGAGPVVAVAPRAGRAVLPEGVLGTHGLPAVAVLPEVTLVLCRAARLSGRLHLVQQSRAHPGNRRRPNTHACCCAPEPQAHPALVAAAAVGTLSPLGQQAGAGIAAAVLTVLGAGATAKV